MATPEELSAAVERIYRARLELDAANRALAALDSDAELSQMEAKRAFHSVAGHPEPARMVEGEEGAVMISNAIGLLGVVLIVACVAGLAGLLWAGLLLGALLVGLAYVVHVNVERPAQAEPTRLRSAA
jgi:hypothetical protein